MSIECFFEIYASVEADNEYDAVEEYKKSLDYRELTDIGNFAAWIWYGGAGNTPKGDDKN